jgi:hypothetical protein
MGAQKHEVGTGGRRDENLAADGHEDWLPGRSWGTICDKP